MTQMLVVFLERRRVARAVRLRQELRECNRDILDLRYKFRASLGPLGSECGNFIALALLMTDYENSLSEREKKKAKLARELERITVTSPA